MVNKGVEFYDNDDIFQNYMNRRRNSENPNDTIEKPIFLELMGNVNGNYILDLGCGDAKFGCDLLNNGCLEYTGIEGSRNMFETAIKTLEGTNGKVILSSIEDWDYPDDTFNLVVSRLALHYIENIDIVFKKIFQTLSNEGRFIFSVEHPILTSCFKSAVTSTIRKDWVVDNYFETGERITPWMGGQVIKYHRTIEDYFKALQNAGFTINALRESKPQRENFENEDTFFRRIRIPLFLFFSVSK
jgi:ubiquinone/menaquinone biosynthesis C-methylase UbiE